MLAGYCWPQSGVAGDVIALAVSGSDPTCAVSVSRVGRDIVEVLADPVLVIDDQPVPGDVAENGCGWKPTLAIEITDDWQTGFYLVRLETEAERSHAFFVVRASEPGENLLVLSTSTWAAYNDWGGPSFYTGGHVSSQQRPLPNGFLDKPDPSRYRNAHFAAMPLEERRDHFAEYSMWSGSAGFANWERLFVEWAESNDIPLDYATSLDLHQDPELLAPYRRYISVGHDEYWSAEMRNHVEDWVEAGGHAAFFSGNTSFWQVRFADDGSHVVGYKLDFALDPVVGTESETTVSTMWSDPLVGRPEAEMTGVSFTRGGYAHMVSSPQGSGGYTVWRPGHWVFEGLDLWAGDLLGAEPVVVGYECDGCEMDFVDGLPVARGTGGTPQNLEVLATAPAHLWATDEGAPGLPNSYVGELNWVAERLAGADTAENRARFAFGSAVLGAFERGDGHVFTTGCTDWAYGLDHHDVATVTRNVLARSTTAPVDSEAS